MAQNVTVQGASYSDVPSVVLPKTGGGTATFTDVSDTTAVAGDVAQGKYFYGNDGIRIEGIASGGGAISVVDTSDIHGGTIRTITAVDISDTTAVAADVAQGKFFYTARGVKTEGTATGGGGDTPEITISSSGSVSQELQPRTIYHFTSASLTALTITFAGAASEQYHFDFISPATAVTLILPSSVNMEKQFSVEPNTKYEIDIYNSDGVFAEWVYGS